MGGAFALNVVVSCSVRVATQGTYNSTFADRALRDRVVKRMASIASTKNRECNIFFNPGDCSKEGRGSRMSCWTCDPSVSMKATVMEEWRLSEGMVGENHRGGLTNVSPSQTGLRLSSSMRVAVEAGLPSGSRSTGMLCMTTLVKPSWGMRRAPVPKGAVRMER